MIYSWFTRKNSGETLEDRLQRYENELEKEMDRPVGDLRYRIHLRNQIRELNRNLYREMGV